MLLLRLAGPLQSWGSAARFVRRTTENAPTKSGVLGLLAAAQGREREADLSDLVALGFGVRIDQPGTRVRDFQTAHHAVTGKSMPLSERFYVADAVFVAGVEGSPGVIAELYAAVRSPVYLPYLGRRSCPPSAPVDLGVHDELDLVEALKRAPWQASDWFKKRHSEPELGLLLDCRPDAEPDFSLRDAPITFDKRHRRYSLRGVTTSATAVPPDHDPTSVLGTV